MFEFKLGFGEREGSKTERSLRDRAPADVEPGRFLARFGSARAAHGAIRERLRTAPSEEATRAFSEKSGLRIGQDRGGIERPQPVKRLWRACGAFCK